MGFYSEALVVEMQVDWPELLVMMMVMVAVSSTVPAPKRKMRGTLIGACSPLCLLLELGPLQKSSVAGSEHGCVHATGPGKIVCSAAMLSDSWRVGR